MLAGLRNHAWPDIFGSGADWAQGDWNHDGVVNFNDYSLMQDNYDQDITSPPDSPTTLTYILSINDDGTGVNAIHDTSGRGQERMKPTL